MRLYIPSAPFLYDGSQESLAFRIHINGGSPIRCSGTNVSGCWGRDRHTGATHGWDTVHEYELGTDRAGTHNLSDAVNATGTWEDGGMVQFDDAYDQEISLAVVR